MIHRRYAPVRERGMALIVGLILLALMTAMAITSFHIGRTSLDIVGNMQRRAEVIAAANGAIQEAMSTQRLFEAPEAIYLVPCAGPNTRCFDIDGDGTNDVTVALTPTPTCVQAQPIQNAALNPLNPNDRACARGEDQQHGVESDDEEGASLCSNSLWEVRAVATDAVTGAQVEVVQGVAVRVPREQVDTHCPAL